MLLCRVKAEAVSQERDTRHLNLLLSPRLCLLRMLYPAEMLPRGRRDRRRGGEKFFSICRVRREEEQVEGYLNKGWWGRSVTVDSRVEKVTADLFFSRVLVPKW